MYEGGKRVVEAKEHVIAPQNDCWAKVGWVGLVQKVLFVVQVTHGHKRAEIRVAIDDLVGIMCNWTGRRQHRQETLNWGGAQGRHCTSDSEVLECG